MDRVEGFDGDVTDDTGIDAVVETITPKFGPLHPDVLVQQCGWRRIGMVRKRTGRRVAQRGPAR